MKKSIILAVALMVCAGAMAQEQEPERRRGGLWNSIKKGVESTTGLNVSREALFVHPVIGEWKMAVVSCEGDTATGQVVTKISVSRLVDPGYPGSRCLISEARVSGTTTLLGLAANYADPLYDFVTGRTVEVTLNTVAGVPTDTKTLDIKFFVGTSGDPKTAFELRDCPINWTTAE